MELMAAIDAYSPADPHGGINPGMNLDASLEAPARPCHHRPGAQSWVRCSRACCSGWSKFDDGTGGDSSHSQPGHAGGNGRRNACPGIPFAQGKRCSAPRRLSALAMKRNALAGADGAADARPRAMPSATSSRMPCTRCGNTSKRTPTARRRALPVPELSNIVNDSSSPESRSNWLPPARWVESGRARIVGKPQGTSVKAIGKTTTSHAPDAARRQCQDDWAGSAARFPRPCSHARDGRRTRIRIRPQRRRRRRRQGGPADGGDLLLSLVALSGVVLEGVHPRQL